VAERVEELRGLLASGRANMDAGHYEQGFELTGRVLTEIESAAWDYPPIRARALLLRSDAMAYTGRPQEALDLGREGTLLALEVGDREGFVRGATNMVWELGDTRSEFEQAHTWADLANATIEQMGGNDDLRARLHNHLGAVLTNEQRYEEALAEHRARLAIVGDSGTAYMSLANIANIYNWRGEWTRAAEAYEQAIEIASAEVGAGHPTVLSIRANLLGLLWRVQPPDEARAFGEELLAAQKKLYGDVHPDLLTTYANLANVAAAQPDRDAEAAFAQEALRQVTAVHGPDHHLAIPSLIRLTRLDIQAKDWAKGRQHAQRALSIAQTKRGPDHLDTAYALENYGSLQLAMGKLDEALASFTKTIDIVLGSDAPKELAGVAESQSARALCEQGKPAEALRMAESAIDHLQHSEATQVDVLLGINRRGEALVDLGRYDEAVEVLDDALERWMKQTEHGGRREAMFDRLRAEVALGRKKKNEAELLALLEGTAVPLLEQRAQRWLKSRRP
jgi:tetratricopeptide (TPR) repeat protein